MQKILLIDMNSLFPMLFWGYAISFMFLLIYYSKSSNSDEKHIVLLLLIARICHAAHYFVTSGRGILPDPISVNLGNLALFVGCYFEARAILQIIRENTKFTDRLMLGILVVFVVLFNAIEFIAPSGGMRITMASAGVVALMTFPVMRMLFSVNSNIYIKPVAVFLVIYLSLLLVRIWYGLQNHDASILTTNTLQSITFLALLLQIIISLPSYILIIKGYADEALMMMATTDKLTGAKNRHAFMGASAMIFNNCKRFRFDASVLFLDIDYFKSVNDLYGHSFGDVVLARVATLIDKCLRGSDLSCRYGGEEFVMLLPRSDYVAARRVAERIMEEVAQARFDKYPEFTFTVSIGIFSGVPSHEQNFANALDAADRAMYQAKQSGRNRIEYADLGSRGQAAG